MSQNCCSTTPVAATAGRAFGLGPAVIALLLPKCPLCVAAWAWVFTALGIDVASYETWRMPVSVALLVVTGVLVRRMPHRFILLGILSVALFGRLMFA